MPQSPRPGRSHKASDWRIPTLPARRQAYITRPPKRSRDTALPSSSCRSEQDPLRFDSAHQGPTLQSLESSCYPSFARAYYVSFWDKTTRFRLNETNWHIPWPCRMNCRFYLLQPCYEMRWKLPYTISGFGGVAKHP